MKHGIFALAAAAITGLAHGQVRFNELLINPPGSDNGFEFIELISDTPNYSLDGLTLLVIEADCGGGCVAGTIDQALSLDGKDTGANRLFLWRDSLAVLFPAPDPATIVHVADFSPDLENGSNTYLIVEGFTGAVGQDLDANNDGILDSTPWTRVLDAVGYKEGDNRDTHFEYATQLGGVDLTDYIRPGTTAFTPDAIARVCGGWVSHDLVGANPGPWFADPAETLFVPDHGQSLDPMYWITPGSHNIECPGPTCDGDVNCDGSVNGVDVEIQELAVGGDVTDYCQPDPDFNRDGAVNGVDVEAVELVVGGAPCP